MLLFCFVLCCVAVVLFCIALRCYVVSSSTVLCRVICDSYLLELFQLEFKFSFIPRTIKVWNNLPHNVV